MLQIVTGKNSYRTIAGGFAATQSLSYISECRLWLLRVSDVVCHLFIVEHELSRLSGNVISSLSNGESYYLDVFAGNLVENLLLLLNAPIEFYKRTYFIYVDTVVTPTNRQRVFAVLFLQGMIEMFVTRKNHRSAYSPVLLFVVLKELVCHILQMSTMKVAHSKMQYTCLYLIAVIRITINIVCHRISSYYV